MAAERIPLLYIYMLTSTKAVIVSSMLQSGNSCNAFPPSVRLLCNKLGALWTNVDSKAEVNSVHDGVDLSSIRHHLGNSAIKGKWKTKGDLFVDFPSLQKVVTSEC